MTGWLPDTSFSLSMAGSGTATARGSLQCTWTLTGSRIPMMVFLSVWQSGRRPRLVWLRSGRPCLLSFRFNLQGGAGSSNGWRFGARWLGCFRAEHHGAPSSRSGHRGQVDALAATGQRSCSVVEELAGGLSHHRRYQGWDAQLQGDATFVVCQEGLGPRAAQAVGISCSEGRQVFGHLFSR